MNFILTSAILSVSLKMFAILHIPTLVSRFLLIEQNNDVDHCLPFVSVPQTMWGSAGLIPFVQFEALAQKRRVLLIYLLLGRKVPMQDFLPIVTDRCVTRHQMPITGHLFVIVRWLSKQSALCRLEATNQFFTSSSSMSLVRMR